MGIDIRDVVRGLLHPIESIRYLSNLNDYNRNSSERIQFSDLAPRLTDATPTTSINHNFYETIWATENIVKSGVKHHVDIGSDVKFLGVLSRFIPVTFIDIRPLNTSFQNLSSLKGTITNLPLDSNSVTSISSLSVIEHIGLGRYGDPLDPNGSL